MQLVGAGFESGSLFCWRGDLGWAWKLRRWESCYGKDGERQEAHKYPPTRVSTECPIGRGHLPQRCVPSTVCPGPVLGVSLGVFFYSRVHFHFHLTDEEIDSECKGPTQGWKSGTLPTVFQLQQLRGGLRWQPLSSGDSSQPSDSQSSRGLVLLQEAMAGLIRSSEMPSRYSPLGQFIYYASGGQAPGGQLAEPRLGASSCLLSPHLLPALGRDLLGQTQPKAVLSLLAQLE